jgi:DNA-directed RNA polymerase subunit M/transcription elongation factor TFIIS
MNGQESVPLSLFHTGRAQCPDCGAALSLTDNHPLVQCQYCGGTASVERRLRMLEPIISDGFITADAPLDAARKIQPSQIISSVAQDESHCPTCGVELHPADQVQAIRKCSHCGTESKIERRLLRSPDADEALTAMDNSTDVSQRRQFAATETLLETVEKSADLPERVRAAYELGEYWCHTNARAARLLPRVLEVLRTSDPRLELLLAELVGKLLCNDNSVLANAVLRAAEKFTFDVNGSFALLRQLSLGGGVGLKLLLDTADYAATRGATDYACCALWSVNTMIERNYADRMRLAEIVLYRLLYLRGPVQSWAIELAQGQMGLGCRFPTPTLLHFIDDCACERLELVPHIMKCFYHGNAVDEAEYLARFKLLSELLTPPARAAALEHLYTPPPSASDPTIAACLAKILALTEDPNLRSSAIKSIADMIDEDETPRECIHAMVRMNGDNLPEDIRRAYLRKVPNSPLLTPLPVKYSNSNSPPLRTAFDEQLEQWKKLWNEGIRQAVEHYHNRQQVARDYWKTLKSEPLRNSPLS